MTEAARFRKDIPLLNNSIHYLDNAATSLMPKTVINAVADYDGRIRSNVGRGVYAWAEQATAHYEEARRHIATAVQTKAEEIIFTSGATAALNLLATSLCRDLGSDDSVWLARDNHHSNIVPWQMAAAQKGFALRWLPAEKNGRLLPTRVVEALSADNKKPQILAVSHIANASGAHTALDALTMAVKPFTVRLVVDGAQYVPHKLPTLLQSGADFYVFSGHKCYAPTGIGVLWGKKELLDSLPPAFGGGGMVESVSSTHSTYRTTPHRFEAGTPPVSQAIGLGAAMRWIQSWDWSELTAHTNTLATSLRAGLCELPGVRFLDEKQPNDAPIISFCVNNAHPHDICQILASHQVAARGGHHCAQPLMQHWDIDGSVRFSLAPYNTANDIDAAITGVTEALQLLQ